MKNFVESIKNNIPLVIMTIISLTPFSISLITLKNGEVSDSIIAFAAGALLLCIGWIESNMGNDVDNHDDP